MSLTLQDRAVLERLLTGCQFKEWYRVTWPHEGDVMSGFTRIEYFDNHSLAEEFAKSEGAKEITPVLVMASQDGSIGLPFEFKIITLSIFSDLREAQKQMKETALSQLSPEQKKLLGLG